MKTIILVIFSFATICNAQIENLLVQQNFIKGDFEFSLFSNIGRQNKTSKSTNESTDSPAINSEFSTSDLYFHIGAAAAYYIINSLSIEPELDINLFSDNSSLMVMGNVNYSFSKPASNIHPFLRIGYGWGQYTTNELYYYSSTKGGDYKILNAGAGLKIKYSKSMMFRMEINYRIMSNSVSNIYMYQDYYNSTLIKNTANIISLSLGTSLIF